MRGNVFYCLKVTLIANAILSKEVEQRMKARQHLDDRIPVFSGCQEVTSLI